MAACHDRNPYPLSEHTQQQGHHEYHQENVEQDLGDLGSASGDARETEYGGNDRNDEEYDGVMQHEDSPFSSVLTGTAELPAKLSEWG
jgi:hypothetical protein